MTIKDLKEFLSQYPDDMDVFIKEHDEDDFVVDLTEDNVRLVDDSAFINPDAPEEEWDTSCGKTEQGDGKQYILICPSDYEKTNND